MKKEYLIVLLIITSVLFYTVLSGILVALWYVIMPDQLIAFVFQGVTIAIALLYAARQIPWAIRQLKRSRHVS